MLVWRRAIQATWAIPHWNILFPPLLLGTIVDKGGHANQGRLDGHGEAKILPRPKAMKVLLSGTLHETLPMDAFVLQWLLLDVDPATLRASCHGHVAVVAVVFEFAALPEAFLQKQRRASQVRGKEEAQEPLRQGSVAEETQGCHLQKRCAEVAN